MSLLTFKSKSTLNFLFISCHLYPLVMSGISSLRGFCTQIPIIMYATVC